MMYVADILSTVEGVQDRGGYLEYRGGHLEYCGDTQYRGEYHVARGGICPSGNARMRFYLG